MKLSDYLDEGGSDASTVDGFTPEQILDSTSQLEFGNSGIIKRGHVHSPAGSEDAFSWPLKGQNMAFLYVLEADYAQGKSWVGGWIVVPWMGMARNLFGSNAAAVMVGDIGGLNGYRLQYGGDESSYDMYLTVWEARMWPYDETLR